MSSTEELRSCNFCQNCNLEKHAGVEFEELIRLMPSAVELQALTPAQAKQIRICINEAIRVLDARDKETNKSLPMSIFTDLNKNNTWSAGLIVDHTHIWIFPMPEYFDTGSAQEAVNRRWTGGGFGIQKIAIKQVGAPETVQKICQHYKFEVTHARVDALAIGAEDIDMTVDAIRAIMEYISPTVVQLDYSAHICNGREQELFNCLSTISFPRLKKLYLDASKGRSLDTVPRVITLSQSNVPQLSAIWYYCSGRETKRKTYNDSRTVETSTFASNSNDSIITLTLPYRSPVGKFIDITACEHSNSPEWTLDVTKGKNYWQPWV